MILLVHRPPFEFIHAFVDIFILSFCSVMLFHQQQQKQDFFKEVKQTALQYTKKYKKKDKGKDKVVSCTRQTNIHEWIIEDHILQNVNN